MPVSTIYITNSLSGCNYTVEQNITTTSCTNYFLRLNPDAFPNGPFNITVVTGASIQTYTGITSNSLKMGIELPLNCP